jgi:hypothetical protein
VGPRDGAAKPSRPLAGAIARLYTRIGRRAERAVRRGAGIKALARLGAAMAVLAATPLPVDAAGAVRAVAESGADRALADALGQAAARCLPLIGETLKVGLSHDVEFRLFPTKQRFADALVEAGEKPAMATRLANYPGVHAVTSAMIVRFNQVTTQPLSARNRQETVCHELTHIYENDLGGGSRPPSHQWMREGYAILMGILGLEAFGFDTLAAVRGRAVRVLKETVGAGKPLPRLSDMASFEQYRDSMDRFGTRPHGFYMILLADHVVALSSHAAIARYFQLSRPGSGGGSPADNFRAAFGLEVAAFQAKLDDHLRDLLR